jgi:aromatic-L-amino-acid/L-tryptophan decarboxylase
VWFHVDGAYGAFGVLAETEAPFYRGLADADALALDPPQVDVRPVVLSIVCFRYVPDHLRGQDEKLDALNKNIVEQVQAGGEAFVSGTTLGDRFALRACVLNYDTVEDDIAELVESVRKTGSRLI